MRPCATFAQPAKHSESPGRKARGLPRGHPERPKSTRRAPEEHPGDAKKEPECVRRVPQERPRSNRRPPESAARGHWELPKGPKSGPQDPQSATHWPPRSPRRPLPRHMTDPIYSCCQQAALLKSAPGFSFYKVLEVFALPL